MSWISPSIAAGVDAVSAFVSAYGREGNVGWINATAPASGAWGAANRAIYLPIVLPKACVLTRFWWLNGATVGTNNLQAGIYDDTFAAVLRGNSTLSAGANICQFDNVTDTPLNPGKYWLALWCNGTTATVFRTSTSAGGQRHAISYDEDSLTTGLPATATPTQPAAAFVPVFGFTTIASP